MEQFGFGRRLMSLLLALAMIVAMIPAIQPTKANAAIGDIEEGETGLSNGIDTSDTISWPIKIFDYMNDGMLFEYSSAYDTGITAHGGGSYGGGEHMTMIDYKIPGADYTSIQGYYNYSGGTYTPNAAIGFWGDRDAFWARYDGNNSEVDRSINQPVDFVSPMSLHLQYAGEGTSKAYGWVTNFARDSETYMSKEDIRYMVIVYKTNEAYSTNTDGKGHQLRPYWSVSDASYDFDYSYHDGDIDISNVTNQWGWKYNNYHTGTLVAKQVYLKPSTDTWTYQIFDMKTDLQESQYSSSQPMSSNNYGIASNWSKIESERIAGVGMSYPLAGKGEAMDISHIAYFGSKDEAACFGEASVKFDNNPGEYLGYDLYYACELKNTSLNPTKPSTTYDFTTYGSGGWTNSTFKGWNGTNGISTSGGVHQGKSYMSITDTDFTKSNQTYAWKSDGWYTANESGSVTRLRYVTIIYRTKGLENPTLGFWLEDHVVPYVVGKDVDTSVALPASEDQWAAFTYDLQWIETKFNQPFAGRVNTFNDIGIKLPEFTDPSQKLDIAYIAYTASDPATFKEQAVEHMNTLKNDDVTNGNSFRNTMTKSTNPRFGDMWNMGSNLSFGLLYGSAGGGWASDGLAGGANSQSNGYFSYPIGYCYTANSTQAQLNGYRTKAATLGMDYRVSNSIYLMNVSSSNPVQMSGIDFGYTLYNKVLGGVMTAGLLESSQTTFTGVNGKDYKVMQYKDDTIHYLATLLRDTLTIPEKNYTGYNYTFVLGSESPIYSEDYDNDGKLDKNEDVDGDGNLDVYEDMNGNGELDAGEDLDLDGHLDVFEDTIRNGKRNGKLDLAEDLDGDGNLDIFEDLDFDGKLGEHEDVDGDGRLDLIEDLNFNGKLDVELGEDLNGNGKLDLTEDTNGNGKLDPSEDKDGDGRLDLIEDLNYNGKLDEGEDLNGNGKLDLTEDVDGNGILNPYEDRDWDGKLDLVDEDLDDDGFLDIEEDLNGNKVLDKCDLASALRKRLGITFDYEKILASASNYQKGTYTAKLGSYSDTMNKVLVKDGDKTVNKLIGPYLQCADNIDTFYDAAYYLLHNLFVADSYNQAENDYNYLVMSKAHVSAADKDAYVFDAGFTRDDGTSALIYNDSSKTISLAEAPSKHQIYYTSSAKTTLRPFVPIDDRLDAPGDPFGINGTPYVCEDGATGYEDVGEGYGQRNYNYVMQANGEFVYHYDDDLFFDFEGDDDVYMFVNGELVLDIGAAHSITKVGFQMNDYVEAARAKMAELSEYKYNPEMTDEELEELLSKVPGLSASQKAEYKRMHRLNLIDGQSYPIDFYYMERHGWGANMRIATNIVMTDPTLVTDKSAYQGTDANGNPIEVDYGALVDASQPVGYSFSLSNNGNTKLYNMSFSDPDIGLTLTPEAGLQTFSKATVSRFTLEKDSIISIKGLDGVVNLDGQVYNVTADGGVSWVENGDTKTANGIQIAFDSEIEGNNVHELRMYQYNTNSLFQNVTALVTFDGSKEVFVPVSDTNGVFGLQADKTNHVVVQGIRVTNDRGERLQASDLTFVVEGYASLQDYKNNKMMAPITVKLENNEQLKAFLKDLTDPQGQTGSGEIIPEGQSSLYWGAGLWQYSTLSVSGIYYSLSPAEQKAKVFNNTVYTTGYKSPESEEVLRGQDQHRIYTPGEPMYYQWSGHDVYLTLDRLWGDVEKNANEASNMLSVQGHGIGALSRGEDTDGDGELDLWYPEDKNRNGTLDSGEDVNGNGELDRTEDVDGDGRLDVAEDKNGNGRLDIGEDVDGDGHLDVDEDLNGNGKLDAYEDTNNNGQLDTGVDTLKLEICDKNGKPLTSADNMYAGGLWTTYDGATDEDTADERTIYFQNNDHWGKVYIYYWSDDNPNMMVWPGNEMTMVEDALYDVFAAKIPSDAQYVIFNIGNDSIKTADLKLPNADYNKVSWDEDNRKLDVGYVNSGMHLFYVQIESSIPGVNASARIPVTFYVTDVKDQTVVLDYGLQTEDLNAVGRLFKGDELLGGNSGTIASLMGVATETPSYLSTFTDDGDRMNRIDFKTVEDQSVDPETGNWEIKAEDGNYCFSSAIPAVGVPMKYAGNRYTMNNRFWFQPTDFMDTQYDLWLNINVHQSDAVHSTLADTTDKKVYHTAGEIDIGTEVQMYKKVTVLPATVVYYEDDFAGITYNKEKGEFTQIGEGSGNLTQGLDMNANYGWDATYQNSANDEMSGNSMMSINLNNPDAVASFDFKGTGFELIGRTNAFDSATFAVKVKDSNGKVIRNMPVITEFTSTVKGCEHPYHNINGYCSYCGYGGAKQGSLHKYANGYCTICGVERKAPTFFLCGDNLSGNDQFVDGKLTKTFDHDQYVWIRDNAGNVYHTNGYPGENASSATLYAGLSMSNGGNKLRVPGGAEATFTLVDNGDGSIALSYITDIQQSSERTIYFDNTDQKWDKVLIYYWCDGNDRMVDWPGVEMDPVGETNIYKYVVPHDAQEVLFNNGSAGLGNQTPDFLIPGDNFIYNHKDGIWSVYGEEHFITLYFKNTYDSGKPHAYAWTHTSGTNKEYLNEWPGTAMTAVEDMPGYYSIQVSTHAKKVIFNNGIKNGTDKAQTADLVIDPEKPLYMNGSWSVFPPKRIIYFKNTEGWENVEATYWSDTDGEKTPVKMKEVREGIFASELPLEVTNIRFGDGTKQTADMTIPDSGNFYVDGTWQMYTGNEGKQIHQVPTIRVNDLPYGEYTVEILGVPAYNFPDDFNYAEHFNPTTKRLEGVEEYLVDSYLYLDGIRIYQPLGKEPNSNYSAAENGAQFYELRNLILDGEAVVATYDVGTTVYTGNFSWAENRNDKLLEGTAFVGNQLSGVNDYMLVGPNNEVYMNGSMKKEAIIFYVSEDAAASTHNLQIAVRGIDSGLFTSGVSTGVNATLYQSAQVINPTTGETSYGWSVVTGIKSGTEQYYTIDYTKCPKVNGNYQVALYVRDGMVSFSSLKLNGLEIASTGISKETCYSYSANGILQPDHDWGDAVITKLPTCKTTGSAVRRCQKCGTREFITLPKEHDCTNGICDTCGMRIVYVRVTDDYGEPKLKVGEGNAEAMNPVENQNNLYVQAVAPETTKVVISDASDKTTELTLPTDGNYFYDVASGEWVKMEEKEVCKHENHDVDGKCVKCGTPVEHVYVDGKCSCGLIEGADTCQHEAHDQDGECTSCGAAVEHVYVDGKCSCGLTEAGDDDSTITIYFDNSGKNWSQIAVHAWNSNGNCTGDWPGITMDFVEGTIYSLQIPKEATDILFNNRNGDQTEDLIIPVDGKNLYNSATRTWSTYGDEPCQHEAHGQDGKCTSCGAAVEHVYVDGKCSCGLTEAGDDDSTITLYFDNSGKNWSTVNIYTWNGGTKYTGEWPGSGMTLVEGSIYSYKVSKEAVNVIFNDGSNQTKDLTIPTDGKNLYDSASGTWSTYVAEASVLSFYTIGQQMQTLAGMSGNELPSDNDGFQIENEIVERPDVKLEYPTISLEDEVTMQVYFSTDADISAENVGLLSWNAAPTMLDKNDPSAIQGGILADNGLYRVSLPISAEKLGDEIYLCVYAELDDGTVIYSDVVTYSVKSYAYSKLNDSNTDHELKALLVSLLNYGAAAQVYFDYKTDALVNADLTAEQQTLADDYNASMVKPVAQPTGSKVSAFAANGGFRAKSATAHFESAFGISYHMTGSVESTGATLYFWTQEQFDALDELNADNCTGSVAMDLESGTFTGFVGGIAAKDINDTVYAATVYTGNDGVTYSTGVLAYSLGAYCSNMVANGSENMSALAAATIVYGFYASAYFGN